MTGCSDMPDPTLKMLHNRSALATTLLVIAIDRLGVECMEWIPEVLEDELQNLSPESVPRRNLDKIHGLILAKTTDRFYNEPKIFIVVCNALSADAGNIFPTFDPPDVKEMAWAVTEMRLHDPVEDLEEAGEFSKTVIQTMQMVKDREMALNPSFLRFLEERPLDGTVATASPGLWEATWSTQLTEAEEVNRFVGHRFAMLISQLRRLQLKNGSVEGLEPLIKRIRSMLDTEPD